MRRSNCFTRALLFLGGHSLRPDAASVGLSTKSASRFVRKASRVRYGDREILPGRQFWFVVSFDVQQGEERGHLGVPAPDQKHTARNSRGLERPTWAKSG